VDKGQIAATAAISLRHTRFDVGIAAMVVLAAESQPPRQSRRKNQRQLGSQISMFHVCCEIGRPVSTGNSHAKLVTTRAT
jgi:hypothetical protein